MIRRRFLLVALLALAGCSTEKDQLRHVVREGRVLLAHPAPGDPEWDARRGTFLDDAKLVDPDEEK